MYIAQFPPKIRITRMSLRFPQVSNRDPMSTTAQGDLMLKENQRYLI